MIEILPKPIEFEWDKGNSDKNQLKHAVSKEECEELFFNKPFIVTRDGPHSIQEQRLRALGKTKKDRKLFIVFTVRRDKIRIISARDQNKKERSIYEKTKTHTTV